MKIITTAVATALAFSVAAAVDAKGPNGNRPVRATANILGCTDSGIVGFASLEERRSDEGVKLVDISLSVRGLPDGEHAVHIHEVGSCTPCSAAGGHFDPGPNGNSNADGNHPFHMGDLVNLEVKHGRGTLHATSSRITLSPGPLSIFDADGSAFIIHVSPDTYCPNGAVAGCAGGARAACAIIEEDD